MSLGNLLRKKRSEVPFIIFVSFLLSFLIARIYVYFLVPGWAGADIFPFEEYIVHHFYYGVALIMIAGWLSLVHKDRNVERGSAVLYGLGLGIFFDEIGLLLTEFADYWAGITYTFVVLISLTMFNFIFFADFWKEVGSGVGKFAKKHKLDHGPLNMMGLVDVLDEVEKKMPKTGNIAATITGLVLLVAGVLVIRYPDLIRYWVGGAFVLSGIARLVQVAKRDK